MWKKAIAVKEIAERETDVKAKGVAVREHVVMEIDARARNIAAERPTASAKRPRTESESHPTARAEKEANAAVKAIAVNSAGINNYSSSSSNYTPKW